MDLVEHNTPQPDNDYINWIQKANRRNAVNAYIGFGVFDNI